MTRIMVESTRSISEKWCGMETGSEESITFKNRLWVSLEEYEVLLEMAHKTWDFCDRLRKSLCRG